MGQAAARVTDPFGHTCAMSGVLVGLAVGAFAASVILSGGLTAIAVGAAVGIAGSAGLAGAAIGQTIDGAETGTLAHGSINVRINGLFATMVELGTGDCSRDSGPPAVVASGSATVRINGQLAARVGEKMDCSAVIRSGSPNVFIGGPTQQVLAMTPEVPSWLTTTMAAMAIGGAVIATGGIAATYGIGAAAGSLVGGVGGSWLGGKGATKGAAALGFGATGQAVAGVVGGVAGGMLGGGFGFRGGAAAEAGLNAPAVASSRASVASAAEPATSSATGDLRAGPSDQSLYRIDGRPPATIFDQGFQPKGTSTDLQTYVDQNTSSGFVSTSKTAEIADNPDFAQPGKHLYEIDGNQIQGIDVNQAYPTNPYAHEQEIAVINGVPRDAIISAKPILPSGGLGNAIPNPYYNGGK